MTEAPKSAELPPRQVSLRRGMVVVLAVLVLIALIFPTGLGNWLDEKCFGNFVCDTLADGFFALERGWDTIGIADARDGLGEWLKRVAGHPGRLSARLFGA